MASESAAVVNVNVGVLGHVDSGKTHLVRVLSTHLSTAALDKHPQSQQRGMTLDLGFSSFRLPAHGSRVPNGPELQITLVDCPGHASLFKTILGGVHIIDAVLLVIDIQKGLQPQTIECLLLAELAVDARIVVALNKIDLVPAHDRAARVAQAQREIRGFLTQNLTKLDATSDIPIVAVAAAPANDAAADASVALGITDLVDTLRASLPVPQRDASGPLCFAIDHCFALQGNGTILTGTVLSGSVAVGDEIELPGLQLRKRVKSLQMFKRAVGHATQGDRVAMRVNGLDASLVERGVAVAPGSLPFVKQVVVPVYRIAFFQGKCKSGAKFHATIGHTTVVAVATFFQKPPTGPAEAECGDAFDPTVVYRTVPELEPPETESVETPADIDSPPPPSPTRRFALLQFEQPVVCPPKAVVVCSRFDLDPKKFHCRLAFHGRVEAIVWDDDDDDDAGRAFPVVAPKAMRLSELKIGNVKERSGIVDKPVVKGTGDAVTEVLAREMFAKDVDWQVYTGSTVLFEQAKALGRILGPFGKSGKFRIELLPSVLATTSVPVAGERVVLRFVKLTTIRPLKRAKTGVKKPPAAHPAAKSKGNLLQDDRILYVEAFQPVPPAAAKTSAPSPPSPPSASVEIEPEVSQASGVIERLKGETTADGRNPFVIVTGLFSDEASARAAIGRKVRCLLSLHAGQSDVGEIEKPFGKAGKVRVVFSQHGGTLGQVSDAVELVV